MEASSSSGEPCRSRRAPRRSILEKQGFKLESALTGEGVVTIIRGPCRLPRPTSSTRWNWQGRAASIERDVVARAAAEAHRRRRTRRHAGARRASFRLVRGPGHGRCACLGHGGAEPVSVACKPCEVTIDEATPLVVLATDEDAAPAGFDPILGNAERLPVIEVIEEQLLLGLPLVADASARGPVASAAGGAGGDEAPRSTETVCESARTARQARAVSRQRRVDHASSEEPQDPVDPGHAPRARQAQAARAFGRSRRAARRTCATASRRTGSIAAAR